MHSIVTALTFSVYTIAFEWKMGHQNNSKNGSLSLHMQSISIFFSLENLAVCITSTLFIFYLARSCFSLSLSLYSATVCLHIHKSILSWEFYFIDRRRCWLYGLCGSVPCANAHCIEFNSVYLLKVYAKGECIKWMTSMRWSRAHNKVLCAHTQFSKNICAQDGNFVF